MAAAYAEEIGAMYLETSAKDDFNVQDIFIQLSMPHFSDIYLYLLRIINIYLNWRLIL